jgi:hypothetical protein
MTRPVYADITKVRVWLEGVEFPYVKSVSVNCSPSGASCQIELPPSSAIKTEQWVGMTVHVFFATRDVFRFSSNRTPSEIGWYKGEGLDDKGWPILFQGELVGDGMSESPSSENLTLSATSHSRHFSQTKLYFWDMQSSSIDIRQQAYFFGNSQINIDADGVLSKQSQLLNTMLTRAKDLKTDGERNIAFTSMIFDLLRSTGKQHHIFNHFNNKFKLTQRFGAYVDPDVKKILQLNQLAVLIDQRVKTLNHSASLMDIIEMCTDVMNYGWVHIAQPILRKDGENKLISDVAGNEFTEDELNTADDLANKSVIAFFTQIREGSLTIVTPIGALKAPNDYLDQIKLKQPLSQETFVSKMLGIDLNDLTSSFNNMLFKYEYVAIGNLAQSTPDKPEVNQSVALDEGAGAFTSEDETTSQTTKETMNLLQIDQARLEAQDELTEFIVVPDMFFAQPPKCNVMMPYAFNSSGIQRDFMSEPTRLYAQVSVTPSGSNNNTAVTEWYIAPASQVFYKLSDRGALEPYTTEYAKFLKTIQTKGALTTPVTKK